MCTIGGVSTINKRGERLTFLMKTIDGYRSDQTEMTHGIYRSCSDRISLFSSIMKQPGINIGMNRHGLALTISYSDCWSPEKAADTVTLGSDTRALANAAILARCTSVDDALDALTDFITHNPSPVGGNHLLIDSAGNIALLEQYQGKYHYEMFSDAGYYARANNSCWLIRDRQYDSLTPEDSYPREEEMKTFLQSLYDRIPLGMENHKIINEAKGLLSSHRANDNQRGSICIHGLDAPGARLFGADPCYTLSAVILDVKECAMHYSLGPPCEGQWQTLTMDQVTTR